MIAWQPFPLIVGGVERYLLYVSRELKRRGYSILILNKLYAPLSMTEESKSFIVHRLGILPLPFVRKRYIGGFIDKIVSFQYVGLGFYKAIKYVKNCNLIHVHIGSIDDLMLGCKLSWKLGLKTIVTIHGRFGTEIEDIPPSDKMFKLLRNANKIIVNRKETFDFLYNRGFTNIEILENPIPVKYYFNMKLLEKFEEPSNKVKFLFIGRLSYRRGIHLALLGFYYAVKKNPNVELWIVGWGPLESFVRSFVERFGLKDRVIFWGKREDVRHFLWSADAFLAVSPIANSPSLALREAMAAGLPVIATDVEATREIVRPFETGIVVPPSPREIGEAMLLLAENVDLRRELALKCVELAKRRFDMRVHVDALERIYNEVLASA
jgi:glycosyltransferase involved in cell wall biosynthesis